MLVLTRKLNEQIIINDTIVIKVIAIKGKNITFGISAPDNVSIHRGERYEEFKDKPR